MFSQVQFMSSLSLKLSKAAKLLKYLKLILFPNLQLPEVPEIKSFYIQLLFCLFKHRASSPNLCNYQIVIRIIVSSPERSYIEYTRIPPPIYQYVISLVVGLPIRRGPGVFMNVSVWEHHVLNK